METGIPFFGTKGENMGTLQEEIRQIVREEIAAAEQRVFQSLVELLKLLEDTGSIGVSASVRWKLVAEALRKAK